MPDTQTPPTSRKEAWILIREYIKKTATHKDTAVWEALGWISPLTTEELDELHNEETWEA